MSEKDILEKMKEASENYLKSNTEEHRARLLLYTSCLMCKVAMEGKTVQEQLNEFDMVTRMRSTFKGSN